MSGIFGNSAQPATIASDTLDTQEQGICLDLVSEGPCLGLADVIFAPPNTNGSTLVGDGSKSIYLNNSPMRNLSGSWNFSQTVDSFGNTHSSKLSWGWRLGNATQDYMHGFSDVESTFTPTQGNSGFGVTETIGPVTQTISDPDMDAINVLITVPALSVTDANGNVDVFSVSWKLEFQDLSYGGGAPWQNFPGDGNTFRSGDYTISGKSSSGIGKQCYCLLRPPGYIPGSFVPGLGSWNIRVTRLTTDYFNDPHYQALTVWTSYTTIADQLLEYPNSALIGIEAPAAAFGGQMPNRAYDWLGRIVSVPANYTPTQYNYAGLVVTPPAYTGIWNGTWTTDWTDNPAWCVLDLLTNPRYGLNVPLAQIDVGSLYTIAQYCDQMIADGYGNVHPRYTLNVQLLTAQDAYTMIAQLCANFMTMVYYTGGLITFAQDSPRDVDIIATPANVVNGQFDYQEQSYENTANLVVAKWLNPAMNYVPDIAPAENTADIAIRGQVVTLNLDAVGVNDLGRATRLARWALYTNMFENMLVTYQAGLDHADIMPGYVVQISDPVRSGPNIGGRVISSTSGTPSTVTLDRNVTLLSGHTYTLNLIMRDKTTDAFSVLTGAGTTNVLSLNTVLPTNVTNGVWTLQDNAITPALFRVISKRMVDRSLYEFTAMVRYANKFSLIESNLVLDQISYTPSTVPVATPVNFKAQEYLMINQSGIVSPRLLLGWTAVDDGRVVGYTVQMRISGVDINNNAYRWVTLGKTASSALDVVDLSSNTYDFQVQANTNFGLSSTWGQLLSKTISGTNQIPSDVTGLTMVVNSGIGTLSWNASTDFNLDSYELRFSPQIVGASWNSASLVQTGVVGTAITVPNAAGTYLVKAVNIGGIYSTNAGTYVNLAPGLVPVNTLHALTEETSWAGTKTNGLATSGITLVFTPPATTVTFSGASPYIVWATNNLANGIPVVLTTSGTLPPNFTAGLIYYIVNWASGAFDLALTPGGAAIVPGGAATGTTTATALGATYSGALSGSGFLNLGGVYTCTVAPSIVANGQLLNNFMSSWVTLASVPLLSGVGNTQYSITTQMRFTQTDPSISPVWGPWLPAQYGDFTFWGMETQLIITSTSANVTVVMDQMDFTITVPDRVVADNNKAVAATSTTTISFSAPFFHLDGLTVIPFNGSTGDTIKLVSQTTAGFTVQYFNSSGSQVAGNISYVAKGYGSA